MSFRVPEPDAANPLTPKRAALYLRVSTGRQAEGEVSLPSQRDLTRRYCEAQGWTVVEEFVEPGASATDDRRPVFQRMLEQATSAERSFDVICVHAFSRFYRNGAEMEMTIRRLKKAGVEVVSVTQPTGDDPSQALMRQIIGIFDEYTSRENGKNVTRAMRESAKQGFWNGATPPLGYRTVDAERRGAKIKKKLDIDPVEAELVRLIFKLYAEGHEGSGPLGVKETTKWLNARGYRTRRGSTFGVGPLYGILTNRCYATGKWPYGRRNSRAGGLNNPADIIEIDVPTIVPVQLFDYVQERLAVHNPKVTPPRAANGPSLLVGLATCASCGAGMTRTGTAKRGKAYSYYSCGGCHAKGKTACKGRHIPTSKLDRLVTDAVRDKLLTPERLTMILEALIDRQAAKDSSVANRRAALELEIRVIGEKLARLYRAIEEGVAEIDAQLKDRISALKSARDLAQSSLERIAAQSASARALTPERIAGFGEMLRQRIETSDIQARKAYLQAVVSEVRVDDHKIQIIGDKASLAAVIAGQQTAAGKVSGFVRKWRTRQDSNL